MIALGAALGFVVELLLWAGVAVVVHGAVGGTLGWLVGVLASVLVVVAWGRWMAPRTTRRLPRVPRAVIAAAGCAVVGAFLLGTGPTWWGIALLAGAAVMVGTELYEGPLPGGPPAREG